MWGGAEGRQEGLQEGLLSQTEKDREFAEVGRTFLLGSNTNQDMGCELAWLTGTKTAGQCLGGKPSPFEASGGSDGRAGAQRAEV